MLDEEIIKELIELSDEDLEKENERLNKIIEEMSGTYE